MWMVRPMGGLSSHMVGLGVSSNSCNQLPAHQHVDCCTHAHLQSAGISEFDSANVMAAHRSAPGHIGRHPRGDRRS